MKNNNQKNGFKKLVMLCLIAALTITGFFSVSTSFATAENSVEVNNDNSLFIPVHSDECAPFFSEYALRQSQRWIEYQPRIGWTFGGDYSPINYTDREITYYPSGGTNVFAGYVNEEIYAVMATDETNETIRLSSVEGVTASSNINANGSVTINFSRVINPRGSCVFLNHTRRLKNLCNDFKIPNCNTKVGNGKILYRQTDGSYFGNWSYTNLSESAVLTFTQAHVQIAVIYSLNEKGYTLGQTDKHFFLAGVYRIDIY